MGILLETALPDRRFIIRLAAWRFTLAFLCVAATAVIFTRPAFDAPLLWLCLAMLFLVLGAAAFLTGLQPLCFLARRVEFYENGISAEPYEIPLERLERVRWKQEPFRLFGLFPFPPYRDCMVCIVKPEGKRKRPTRAVVSGFYFMNLRESFDRAYEFSLPWEFVPYHKKLRRRPKKTRPLPKAPAPEAFIGPPVPPAPPLMDAFSAPSFKEDAEESAASPLTNGPDEPES